MGGRKWTDEEIAKLEEWAGMFTVEQMAKKLGRSWNAVNLQIGRLGIPGIRRGTEHLSMRQLSIVVGIDSRTIYKKWVAKGGLKPMRKGSMVMFSQDRVIRFMRDHPDYWNARLITDDSLFLRYPWYQEKKRTDVLKSRRYWTPQEVSRLHTYEMRGMKMREIAERMGRTESSIKQKLHAERYAERTRKNDTSGINRAV